MLAASRLAGRLRILQVDFLSASFFNFYFFSSDFTSFTVMRNKIRQIKNRIAIITTPRLSFQVSRVTVLTIVVPIKAASFPQISKKPKNSPD